MSALQRSVKHQLSALNNVQDSLYLQKVIQKIKPELQQGEEQQISRLVHLKNNGAVQRGQNPAVVFQSLIHKSASISKDRNSLGYEETFNIYK